MNVNEVIASRANEIARGTRGGKQPVHPNDDVNRSQSSNDTFPTALHMAAAMEITGALIPSVRALRDALDAKAGTFEAIVKIGRTHLQDAVPLTLGQEFSGYVAQLDGGIARLEAALPGLYEIALGGTAVAPAQCPPRVRRTRRAADRRPHRPAVRDRAEQVPGARRAGGHGVRLGCSQTLATSLMKIANDIRWLGSGPRAGLGELRLPENELAPRSCPAR